MSIEGEADFAVCFFCKRYQCPNIDTWSNFFQIAVTHLSKRLIQVTTYIIITSVLISARKKAWIDKKKNIPWCSRLFSQLWKNIANKCSRLHLWQIGRNEVKTMVWGYCFKFHSRKDVDQSYKRHRIAPSAKPKEQNFYNSFVGVSST